MPLHDVAVRLRVPERITRVELPLERTRLTPRRVDGAVAITVPRLVCHQVVVFSYSGSRRSLSAGGWPPNGPTVVCIPRLPLAHQPISA